MVVGHPPYRSHADQDVELPDGDYIAVVNACLGYINDARVAAGYGGMLSLIDFLQAEQGVVSDGEVYLVVIKVKDASSGEKLQLSFDCREHIPSHGSEDMEYQVEGIPLPEDIMPPDWVADSRDRIHAEYGPNPIMNILSPNVEAASDYYYYDGANGTTPRHSAVPGSSGYDEDQTPDEGYAGNFHNSSSEGFAGPGTATGAPHHQLVPTDGSTDISADDSTDSPTPTHHCEDGIVNDDETDVDCGGSCPGCGAGLGCYADGDCSSGSCERSMVQTLHGSLGTCQPIPADGSTDSPTDISTDLSASADMKKSKTNLRLKAQLKKMVLTKTYSLGHMVSKVELPVRADVDLSATALPDSYNVLDDYPSCATEVQDQGVCGSCYAFSTTAMLSMRQCMLKGNDPVTGWQHVELSAQTLVSCGSQINITDQTTCAAEVGTFSQACDGGNGGDMLQFAAVYGLDSQHSYPYTSGGGSPVSHFDVTGEIVAPCDVPLAIKHEGERKEFHTFVYAVGKLLAEDQIQAEILAGGPVYMAFEVYGNLFEHSSGVHSPDTIASDYQGLHSVVAYGWGVDEDGTPYWMLQNSWGKAWGTGGRFKLARGRGLVESVYYGSVDPAAKENTDVLFGTGADPECFQDSGLVGDDGRCFLNGNNQCPHPLRIWLGSWECHSYATIPIGPYKGYIMSGTVQDPCAGARYKLSSDQLLPGYTGPPMGNVSSLEQAYDDDEVYPANGLEASEGFDMSNYHYDDDDDGGFGGIMTIGSGDDDYISPDFAAAGSAPQSAVGDGLGCYTDGDCSSGSCERSMVQTLHGSLGTCQPTEAPTPEATSAPTASPTSSPTSSIGPTSSPTTSPTSSPSPEETPAALDDDLQEMPSHAMQSGPSTSESRSAPSTGAMTHTDANTNPPAPAPAATAPEKDGTLIGMMFGIAVGVCACCFIGMAYSQPRRIAYQGVPVGPVGSEAGTGSVYDAFAQSPPQQQREQATTPRASSWGFYMYQKQPATPGA
jgi:cathepsin B